VLESNVVHPVLANFMGDSAMIAPREMVVREALKLPEGDRVIKAIVEVPTN